VAVLSSSALKKEASVCSDALIPFCQIALPHVPQNLNLHINAVRNPNLVCFFAVVILTEFLQEFLTLKF